MHQVKTLDCLSHVRGIQRAACQLVLLWPVCLGVGCGFGGAPSVDPELAQTSLTTFLDAWKEERTPESLRDGSPEIIVGEHRWKSQMRLLSYEVQPPTMNDGANLHVPVALELEDSEGTRSTEEVTYIVGTRPKITVFPEGE
jgi:hypothetical protein